ncbi:Catechol-2,3-dioxygenase [Roseivivax jejudonensis]|uniref:Catechol-2,3-dioxygenase n=1 Tax=Roseivivax jejudonensis TaxID=1529041 RepID=A0A1X6YA35_9RHOB|nr:VOC family protein [Roseivivax jejudonensis]SLN14874.1 Catechol-2,3-dioxygenase [Roseivivax jejudonensis]
MTATAPTTAPPDMRIGHVHLRVSDLDRSIAFYRDVIGLTVTQRYGTRAAFLSAGGYHHHIGLNTWDSAGAAPAPRGHPGLYHTAFLFPDRATLGAALGRAVAAGVEIEGAADHGVSEAVYFSDPDGNGIEIYRDRAETDWPRDADGQLSMSNTPLDLRALLAEAA